MRFRFTSTLAVLVISAISGVAQQSEKQMPPPLEVVATWLNNWPRRADQLHRIDPITIESASDSVKLELISWLNTDSDYSKRYAQLVGRSLGEGFGDYYVDLALLVAKMRDERAIPALSKAVQVGGAISDALMGFGDASVSSLIDELSEEGTRVSVIVTLGRFVSAHQSGRIRLSADRLQQIEDELIARAKDPSGPVRIACVRAIGEFRIDDQITELLHRIAQSDDFEIIRSGKAGVPERAYPARVAASQVLQKAGRNR